MENGKVVIDVITPDQGNAGGSGITQPELEGPLAKYRQTYTAVVAHSGAIIMGMVFCWSSTALPSLRKSHNDVVGLVTPEHENWIASIVFISGAIGSIVNGWTAQHTGLKASLQIAVIPMFLGWVLIAWAPSVAVILLGRFITGFFVASVCVSTSLVADISSDSRRGVLNLGFALYYSLGVLLTYTIGNFWEWRTQAAISSLFCAFLFMLLPTIPESPLSLVRKGEEGQARSVLKWIYDNGSVDGKLKLIQSLFDEKDAQTTYCGSIRGQYLNFGVMKPILLSSTLQFFLQFSGSVPIFGYSVDILGSWNISGNISSIILGLVCLSSTVLATVLVGQCSRRCLLIVSEALLTTALLSLAFYFATNSSMKWVPLACLLLFTVAYSIGVGPLPWVIMGEILSPKEKGFSFGVVTFIARIFSFIVTFFFKDLMKVIGQEGVYLVFACIGIAGMAFTYLFVPETKGKSIDDIQHRIRKRWIQYKD